MKKIAAFLYTFFTVLIVTGQNQSKLANYAEETFYSSDGRLNFLRIKESQQIKEGEIVDFINAQVLENGDNKVSLLKIEKDELGFSHHRFQIFQKGVLVADKIIIAHFRNGKLVSLNGDLASVTPATNQFAISEKSALSQALAKVNAEKYKWDNKGEELHMREVLNDPDFSYYPTGTKVVFEKNGKMLCAYKFNIYAETPLYRANVYVDATSGKILEEQNLICTSDVPGVASTKYSGSQSFTVDYTGSLYRLRETGRGLGIATYNLNNTTTYSASVDFTNTSATWNVTGTHQGATDAHWGAEKTYDYYLTQHSRNSINGSGFPLISYIHYNTGYTNAFWDGQRMTYGDGNGSSMKIFTTLDICAHEITHGLTSNTGNLIYQNESGALNEAFSDIFGVAIENYGRPSNWNWKIGEDMTNNGFGLRNMANPNQFQDPDTYGGTYYYTGTADNGGVHTNSNVGNYWFYLLVTGGSGTNDLTNAFNVTGIGMTDAAKIAFRALTVYFTPSTNYAQARNLSIQAAKDLFGICSNQMIQTTKAWYAVGVGADYVIGSLGPNFSSTNVNFCSPPATVSFSNTSSNGVTYSWDFGDGATDTNTNTAHTYTTSGSYSVKLKAFGCLNAKDSITKTGLVVIHPPVTPPTVSGVSTCAYVPTTLSANSTGNVFWYGSPSGGLPISNGNTFVISNLTGNTTYYASNSFTLAPSNGGILSNTGGGYLSSSNQWLIFDVVQTGVLNSVVVYAQTAGIRTIQLRNSSNTIINTTTVNLAVGPNTVALGYNLNPATNYQLGLSTTSSGNLYRTNTGVSYPYNIGGCINITSSSTGSGSYYWFYNWEITTEGCESQRVAVPITVNPNPTVTSSAASTLVCSTDEVELSGEPSGGVFSGFGVSGNAFNASAFGVGNYTVTYTYTDPNGCVAVSKNAISTEECTGIVNHSAEVETMVIYPNPAKEFIVLKTNSANLNYSVTDVTGKSVLSGKLDSQEQKVELNGLSNGLYLLNLKDQKGSVIKTVKMVKE